MVESKKQTMRYDDSELSLIKNTFAGKEENLKLIRKVMFQFPLNAVDSSNLLLSFKSKELIKVLRKAFLPEIQDDVPFGQTIDLWMTVNIIDKTPEEAFSHLEARKILIEYIGQQIDVLEGIRQPGKEKIKFDKLSDITDKIPKDAYSEMVARNTILGHVEQQLMMFNILAGMPEETVGQTKERLKNNSNK